jgi:hypothetical protein
VDELKATVNTRAMGNYLYGKEYPVLHCKSVKGRKVYELQISDGRFLRQPYRICGFTADEVTLKEEG